MAAHKFSGQFGVAKVLKTDNGYRGVCENNSERGLWSKGDEIFNRQFHAYPKGTLMNVTIRISQKGRKMVQKVEVALPVLTELKSSEEVKSAALEKAWRAKRAAKGAAVESKVAEAVGSAPFAEVKETVASGVPLTEVFAAEVLAPAELEEGIETVFTPKVTITKEEEPVKKTASPTQGYYIAPEARLAFTAAHAMSKANPAKAVKLMMMGPSGYGKTTLPKLFAQMTGASFMRMNCAQIRDPEEWFGYREALEGSTIFIKSEFAKAIEKGNLVVVLDEFNRLEPWLHNTLFPLLDDDGCTKVHDQEFKIGPSVLVVGTINTGYKYTGTFELDEALLNRFEFVLEVGPMEEEQEVKVLVERTNLPPATAKEVTRMANILRGMDVVCSTRTTLRVGEMIQSGLSVRQAYEYAVVRRIPSDSAGTSLRKSVVDAVNAQVGAFDVRVVVGDVFEGGATVPEGEPVPVHVMESTHRIEMHRTGDSVGMLGLITAIRRLPLVTRLSVTEAQQLAEKVRDGQTVTLQLTDAPSSEVISTLKSVGVGGKYSAVRV